MNNGAINLMIPVIIFIVLFALGQIFNREQAAAQQRAAGGGPLGPRPGGQGSSWSTASVARPQVTRPNPVADPRARGRDDDIVIISGGRAAPARALPEAVRVTANEGKARKRARANQAAPNPPSTRSSRPTTNVSLTPASLVSNQELKSPTDPPVEKAPAPVDRIAGSLHSQLRDRDRVREAITLTVLLQPPPGLRTLTRVRRRAAAPPTNGQDVMSENK